MDRPTGDFKHPCTIVECSSQIASLVDGEGGGGGGRSLSQVAVLISKVKVL